MKIDLGKVTSIQLTLAISVIPEDIAIVTEELKNWSENTNSKYSQQKVIPIILAYHCITVMQCYHAG